MPGPLHKYRVLELGRVFAAPWSGQMLADLGAEVIKVEALEGDPMRSMGLGVIRDADGKPTGDHSVFAAVNRNKKSMTVDITKPEGVELVKKLATRCDVFIENYKVGDLARRGLDYESVRAVNPNIIYLSLTGFGQDGPYKNRPGMDNIIQGLTGYVSMAGEAEGPPIPSPVSIMDFAAGMHASVAMLAALINRDLNGAGGEYIDVALLDSGLAMLGYKMIATLLQGEQQPRGYRTKGYMPSGIFQTSDGWIQIMVTNDVDFGRFCEATERPDLLENPLYADRWIRTENQKVVLAETAEIMKTRPTAEWAKRLSKVGLMVGPVLSLQEAADNEQVKARDTIMTIKHAKGGDLPIIRNAIRMKNNPITEYRSPPILGAHADEVLSGVMGLSEQEITELRVQGVIGPLLK